ncbi:hypothetical protein I6F30_19485 [Bradyrhizobium sp. NBAIM20]|uniref:Regulator of replication initiation timing n=1 Tax=Bradyrhizobium yuanmingense TaxID=108015 RepID=A0A0R3C2H0_9BRAD|nr:MULTISPECIES: hypothetical protein [Bradyrhizobium]KRP90620.1 hypothetical protein AOQ72_33000 [Bradyrhizobium yuanmingense]MCA1378024.1 hypothetical protein [Bradyrhizobium sp. IC4060]MCA1387544.1 hypothetical protein [Bradyrhizobium sp. IC3123]MCA1413302.1 hypothetical protein [Bradyrhizobium sp. NBAIM20]MCA1433637.1 hypothetical protein [Bradyrhizobium sp. BRP20]
MADIGKELIFELLKQIEQTLGDVEYKIDEIRSELSACREEQLLMLHDLQVAQSTWSGRRGM